MLLCLPILLLATSPPAVAPPALAHAPPAPAHAPPAPAGVSWKATGVAGLEVATVAAPTKSSHGASQFSIVRIDPKRRKFRLKMASELGGEKRTATSWATASALRVVVNAGMFDVDDHRTSTHYMRSRTHINNPRVRGDNAFFVFGPKRAGLPRAQILDRTCTPFETIGRDYHVVIQGIRMVSCKRENRWSKQAKKWSMVVVAEDDMGRILFIHSRSPYRVHVFVDMVLALPLGVQKMMYLEGGPEASLVVNAGDEHWSRVGSYETGFWENDDNREQWPLPNVIGVE